MRGWASVTSLVDRARRRLVASMVTLGSATVARAEDGAMAAFERSSGVGEGGASAGASWIANTAYVIGLLFTVWLITAVIVAAAKREIEGKLEMIVTLVMLGFSPILLGVVLGYLESSS